jgi:SPP1 gp7 family putative phage head morphogenesis protein
MNNTYWRGRALEIQNNALQSSLAVEQELNNTYERSLRLTLKDYVKLTDGLNEQQLKQKYKTDKKFKKEYDRLSAHINQYVDRLGINLEEKTKTLLQNVYLSTRIAYEGYSFNLLNTAAIARVIENPWCKDGVIYSQRIWKNTNLVKTRVQNLMLDSVLKGSSVQTTAKQLQHEFGVQLYQAQRLVRTETIALYSQAAIDSYRSMDVPYYEVIGDGECGTECPVDTIFRLDEFDIGTTAPPFHPNCKCCIAPVY